MVFIFGLDGTTLVGLGAVLAGLGSFLTGWAALRAAKKEKGGTDEITEPGDVAYDGELGPGRDSGSAGGVSIERESTTDTTGDDHDHS